MQALMLPLSTWEWPWPGPLGGGDHCRYEGKATGGAAKWVAVLMQGGGGLVSGSKGGWTAQPGLGVGTRYRLQERYSGIKHQTCIVNMR
jgi:hypothetical protein